MRNLLSCLAILAFTYSTPALAGTRTVSGEATGKYHVEVLNRWTNVPIVVYVDDAANAYIMSTDTGIVKARGFLTPSDTKQVTALLKKSQQWANTAKAEQMEVTKPLGRFMRGSGYQENGVSLTFFSSNKGNQTDVILTLVDFDNQFFKLDLYLNPQQVTELVRLLEKVPTTHAELKKQNSAAAKLR